MGRLEKCKTSSDLNDSKDRVAVTPKVNSAERSTENLYASTCTVTSPKYYYVLSPSCSAVLLGGHGHLSRTGPAAESFICMSGFSSDRLIG